MRVYFLEIYFYRKTDARFWFSAYIFYNPSAPFVLFYRLLFVVLAVLEPSLYCFLTLLVIEFEKFQ